MSRLLFLFASLVLAASIAAKPPKVTTATRSVDYLTSKDLVAGKVKDVEYRRDVTYLPPDRKEKLDVYLPVGRDKGMRSPAIVMIHGGGWIGGEKDARREVNAGVGFARAGYVAISVEYEKTRGKSWPTNLYDCKNAVRWLRKNAEDLQVDPDRIGVIGGSAGGHLALMTAYTTDVPELEPKEPYPGVSDQVDAVVNLYGITNLLTRQGTDETGKPNGKPKNAAIMMKDRKDALEEWKLASPVEHVTSSTPPTFTLHGTADTTVDRDQATELEAKLKAAGVSNKIMLIQGAPHSFVLNDHRLKQDLTPEILEFFRENLK